MIETINPATGKRIEQYALYDHDQITKVLEKSQDAYGQWSVCRLDQRIQCVVKLVDELLANRETLAVLITQEMGKPIVQAEQEIDKCVTACRYIASMAQEWLQPRVKAGTKSYVVLRPLGSILGIMPWNYPFWQVIRFAMGNVLLGNTVLVKHAPITTGCGLKLMECFAKAGFPEGVMQALVIDTTQVKLVIEHPGVQGVSLTGSAQAGRAVGALAGAALKKSVLELGGSDPVLVLADNDRASLRQIAENCVRGRMIAAGQVCISPKRLIVVEAVRALFEQQLAQVMSSYQCQDPMDRTCQLGPCAREDLRATVHAQVQKTVAMGAVCHMGGRIPQGAGFYYPPTLLTNIPLGSPARQEEIFGPVVSVLGVKDTDQAIAVANELDYGLGAAVYTQNIDHGEKIAADAIMAGTCTVNMPVHSDPSLPFGGIRDSGYGRELGQWGMSEFANVKTVSVGDR